MVEKPKTKKPKYSREPVMSMKVVRTKYVKSIDKAMLTALYRAYSKWNALAYQMIKEKAPINEESPTKRWPRGFVMSHIKLVTKRRPPYYYQEVDVPERSHKGSRGWRAWIAIKSLHEGHKDRYLRAPTRKKALYFPARPHYRRQPEPGETKIWSAYAKQRGQMKRNPWITKVWKRIEPKFMEYYKDFLAREKALKERKIWRAKMAARAKR